MKTRGVSVVVKGEKDSKFGYLKLSYRAGNHTKVESLGIRILKKDFNKRTQLMRSTAPDFEEINKIIEFKTANFGFFSSKRNQPKTILEFMEDVINKTLVKGSKQKYENIRNLFKEFLIEKYDKRDMIFGEFDEQTVLDFFLWLRTKKDRKNSHNTANHKLKNFRFFINQIEKKNLYKWSTHPFNAIELSYDESKKEFLSLEELKTFINYNFDDTRKEEKILIKQNDIKNAFIFSTLAQGLRISDIMTLRWNDFDFMNSNIDYKTTLYIRKRMVKTRKMVNVFLNYNSIKYIEPQILRIIETYLKNDKEIKPTYQHLLILKDEFIELDEKIKKIKMLMEFGEPEELEDFEPIDSLEYDLEKLKMEIFIDVISLINYISQNEKTYTKFIFPFLDDKLFSDIDQKNDFLMMDDKQYLMFQGRRSYLNRLLKEMFKQIIKTKKLSFHSARHTYTSLMIDLDKDGMNVYDLMKMLGHTSISSTEKYAKSFNYKKINKLNSNLTDMLF